MTESTLDAAGVSDPHEQCHRQLIASQVEILQLREALGTARRIGAAIGILMVRDAVTEDAAWELLASFSQQRNRKVRDLADQVVLEGQLP